MTEAESELLSLRRARVKEWTDLGVDPFGSTFPNTERCAEASANFIEERPVRVAGRLTSKRGGFGDIRDETGKIQVYAHAQGLGEKIAFWKLLDIGDFIGGSGTLFTTKTGEKTVRLSELQILSKSLRPIPSQWYGLADVEQRYRQRYVDLIVNEDAKRVLLLRSKIVREIRNFMEELAFTEVETPMMQTIAGGAAANPFKTHHKALGIDLFLRIAPELYLKRLLVGGLTRIYEINRNFRNEGISRRHNPEFTMLEAYWAYADFEQMAELVEKLIVTVAQKSVGTLQVGGRAEQEGIPARAPIDLTPPFRRARYKDLVMEAAGADWFTITPAERRTRCARLGVEVIGNLADYEVTNQVFEKLVEAKSHNPLFVTHLPKELVPLAKQNKEDPSVVDVFELIIGGQEVAPGYTELNDPITQRARLMEQAGEETQSLDEDFLHALEYGMPPAGGIGIGIDRLVMTLTGADSVRDVIYFPLLKPKI